MNNGNMEKQDFDKITTRFEDVKKQTTEEYFNDNQFSIDAFNKKYSAFPTETYVQALKRVCDYVASVEKTEELQKYWSERWFDEIYNDWWHPAGSIMQGAGTHRKISLANCFTENTKFITDKGVKSFMSYKNGDKVNILSNYGGYKEATVKCFGEQDIVNLTLMRNGIYKEIQCTPNHLWRTIDNDNIILKETKDLTVDDKIPHIKRKYMESEKGRYFCPLGFIHGLVFGDGYYNKQEDYCNLDLIGDSKDYSKFFEGFDWNIRKTELGYRISYLPNYMKQFPDFNKVNSEYILGFIIGWFAADGTIDENGRTLLYHNDKDNLISISSIMESLGIYTSPEIQIRRDTNKITIMDKEYINNEKNYQLYSIYLQKDCLFSSFFVKKNHIKNYESYIKNKIRDKSKVQWSVVSIEYLNEKRMVWCVEEPENHNFTLQGGVNTNNCTTISLGSLRDDEEWDSLESIMKNTAYTVAKCAAYRQGLGVDFSRLRPSGTAVSNSANKSTGAVHWMKHIDGIGYSVGQKGRIPAMLFSLNINHPDIEEFITVKSDYTKIQNANISVQLTEKFYNAVEDDKDWEMSFEVPAIKKGDKVYIDVHSIDMDTKKDKSGRFYKIATHNKKKEVFSKTVKARQLMELIAKNMHQNAEPGIQNIDIARKYSNSDAMYDPSDEYDSRIIGTNACSEQYLSRESLCVLASANVGKFSIKPEIYINELEKIGISMNRFLDNVNECELVYQTYATPHQKLAIQKLRRTGAGVTNIAEWLLKKGLIYASKECNDEFEEFMKLFNFWLYYSSEITGKEKGNFGLFNKKKWKSAPFIVRLLEESVKLTKKYGIPLLTGDYARNVTNSSIAPTGTLTLMFRTMGLSYGIEAAFFLCFWKRTRMSGSYKYYFIVPNAVRELFVAAGFPIPMKSDSLEDTWDGKHGKPIVEYIEKHLDKVGIKFKASTEIDPSEKLEFMSKVMKWVDSSISTTYLLPLGSDWKSVYKFIIESHKKEVKSIAAFPDKKMYGIVSNIAFKDLAFKLKDEGVGVHHQNFDDVELKELNISRQKIGTHCYEAPERLPVLDADIYVVNVKGEKFCIAVGLQNNVPYEIFGGHLNGLGLKSNFKHGKIYKVKKGQYSLEIGDITIEDFSKQFTPTEQIMFRLASTSLRHGVPLQFIVDQLHKSTEDITSMCSAAARVLKKYIKNGEEAKGQACPSCGNGLVYLEGCVSCTTCGWSKCS